MSQIKHLSHWRSAPGQGSIPSRAPSIADEPRIPASRGDHHWLPPQGARLAAFSWVTARFPFIGPCLDAEAVLPLELHIGRPDGILGWGDRLPARLARRYAEMRGLRFWTLEDGFLRSAGLGKQGAASVSLIADDLGTHFSPDRASRLEHIINHGSSCETIARAGRLRERIIHERLTKYNHLPDRPPRIPSSRRHRILLVDQVRGDRSVGPARMAHALFARMWDAARARRDAQIIVRSHPDVLAGKAQGHLGPLARGSAHWIDEPISAHAVLDQVDEIWTVSSQLGLDAVLRGVPVVTFGIPAYAGWGLTEDRAEDDWAVAAFARRRRRISADELTAATLLEYPLYFDPVRGQRIDADGAIDRLLSLRKHALERKGHYLVVGFSRHKRKSIRRFVEGPWSSVSFAAPRVSEKRLKAADHVVVWGTGRLARIEEHQRLLRVEDGFIRSAGLGAALTPPASLCLDAVGLHYDATRPSELETLLNTAIFSPALLRRARRLRARLVQMAITKYNLLGTNAPDYRKLAGGRRIVVAAGQVPGDRSLTLGLALHRSNLELLAAVRAERLDAFLIYKEHPDLVSGLRAGASPLHLLERHADLVVGDVPVCDLLDAADEVHVATSQLGFEALLRGRSTICHGVPFYAGWGLTEQRQAPLRPRRALVLDELIAGTLIVYARYVSAESHIPCEVEDVVEELARSRCLSARRFATGERSS